MKKYFLILNAVSMLSVALVANAGNRPQQFEPTSNHTPSIALEQCKVPNTEFQSDAPRKTSHSTSKWRRLPAGRMADIHMNLQDAIRT